MSELGKEFEIRFGDKFATTDTNEYLPVEGFRSGHPHRPTILVAGAWYYPYELRRPPVCNCGEPNPSKSHYFGCNITRKAES